MQDDVDQFVTHILNRYQIEPKKVAYFGNSHGGYLALNLLRFTNSPGACAAAGAATANLNVFIEENVRVNPGMRKDLYMVAGDPSSAAGREELMRRSPASEPERFGDKRVLLLHGALDSSAPLKDVQDFANSIARAGADVSLIEFRNEGHSFSLSARLRALDMVERFFAVCMGGQYELGAAPGATDDLSVLVRSSSTAFVLGQESSALTRSGNRMRAAEASEVSVDGR
jgi:dipeptidyl aminopeptidase/acylaminoacyl peptidase